MNSAHDGASDDADFDGPALLPQDEALDEEEVDIDLDEGYSPGERPRGVTAWGTTAYEEAVGEALAARLEKEEPEVGDLYLGDGIGDTLETDGEPIDDQVGDVRTGRLAFEHFAPAEPRQEYWAIDVGVDGGGASAEEAAMHLIPDQSLDDPEDDEQARDQGHR